MKFLIVPALLLALAGCAANAPKQDPWMGFNREMHKFNHDVDLALLKPASQVYNAVVPAPVNRGISNFFSNLGEIPVIANNLLQLKFTQTIQDSGRFLVNSTIGLLGFLDPATDMGLVKHHEDFGQTLGVWGVPSGPYLVLPLLGPSSLRDFPGQLVDKLLLDPRAYAAPGDPERWTRISQGVQLLDTRADLLQAEKVLDTAATDPYNFLRDAYLQKRQVLVQDGKDSSTPAIRDDELFDDVAK